MASDAWMSVPWTPVTPPNAEEGLIAGWQKKRVPYVPNATYLQTFDIWVPSSPGSAAVPPPEPSPSSPFQPGGLWIIYIHGGAWRDPLVDSSSFERTAVSILAARHAGDPGLSKLAGLVSLNYNLSAHPNHPTHPAPPREVGAPLDPARDAHHPDHIRDVLAALSFLQQSGVATSNYVLAGHSCGATLAFQVAMNASRWRLSATDTVPVKPSTLVGLNGLYDLPAFLAQPGEGGSHKALLPVYESFTRGAFGADPAAWSGVCPTVVDDWQAEWPEGRRVVLVQSHEDKLVPYSQLQIMDRRLKETAPGLAVTKMEAGDDHNELWSKGNRLCEIVIEVITTEAA